MKQFSLIFIKVNKNVLIQTIQVIYISPLNSIQGHITKNIQIS